MGLLKKLAKLFKKEENIEQQTKENLTEEEKIKEEFKVGVATGYFLRSLKEIENILNRMEATQVTKDWFLANFEDKTPELMNTLRETNEKLEESFKRLEENVKRIESMLERLQALTSASSNARGDYERLQALTSSEEFTEKEAKALEIIMERGEIGYEDLAKELEVSLSYTRALLSKIARNRPDIVRFKREGKGWVKIIR
ncbi:MAG: hypothetical protein J7K83_01795 [Candidatus Aenigmarchaeota archaeon]|nr:hypothetical protein [Candidatus Aenigmarchaeota archaeon]